MTIINQTKKSSAGEPFVWDFFLFTSGTPDMASKFFFFF
jgi:hypothetical protein